MRLIVALLLLSVAGPAWAEWVKYAERRSDGTYFYYDPATIQKRGNLVRVAELHDHEQRGKQGELSGSLLSEYDCKRRRWQILSLSLHSERMGRGTVLLAGSPPAEWTYIRPTVRERSADRILQIVCAEWVMYAETEKAMFYYDPDTIEKINNVLRVHQLQDFRQRHTNGELSKRYVAEYDCRNKRFRVLYFSSHSEQMGRGKTIISPPIGEPAGDWAHLSPESVGITLLRIVCK